MIRAKLFDDGKKLLLPDSDEIGNAVGAATIWDLTTRKELRRVKFATHEGRKSTIIAPTTVNRDATRFVDVDGNGDAWVWDADGKAAGKLAEKVAQGATQQFLADGQTLLTVEMEGRCRFWNTATGAVTRTIDLQSKLWLATVSPDGTKLATIGTSGGGDDEMIDATLFLWDLATGQKSQHRSLGRADPRASKAGQLQFTPDGGHLVLVTYPFDKAFLEVQWWATTSAETGRWISSLYGQHLHPIALSRDTRLLALRSGAGKTAGTIRLFDWSTGREKVPPQSPASAIESAWFSLDGSEVHTSAHDGETWTWNAVTGHRLRVQDNPIAWLTSVVEPDPLTEAELYEAMGLRPVFATPEQRQKQPTGPDAKMTCHYWGANKDVAVGVALLPITPTEAGRVYVVDVATKKVRWMVPVADTAPTAVTFSQDGSRVAVGTTVVRVYDATNGKLLATFDGHRGAITALDFSKDGKRLVSGSTDTTALVWTLPE